MIEFDAEGFKRWLEGTGRVHWTGKDTYELLKPPYSFVRYLFDYVKEKMREADDYEMRAGGTTLLKATHRPRPYSKRVRKTFRRSFVASGLKLTEHAKVEEFYYIIKSKSEGG